MQRANREKSQKRIQELTQEHQNKKQAGGVKELTDAQKKRLQENLSDSDGSDVEGDGDVKMKNGKAEKKYENKNTVAKSKMENKRQMKEAIKKIKSKRQKGTSLAPNPDQQQKVKE